MYYHVGSPQIQINMWKVNNLETTLHSVIHFSGPRIKGVSFFQLRIYHGCMKKMVPLMLQPYLAGILVKCKQELSSTDTHVPYVHHIMSLASDYIFEVGALMEINHTRPQTHYEI